MKKLILLLIPITLLLSGCGKVDNEQIIKDKNLCLEGGMDYKLELTFRRFKRYVLCIKPRIFNP